MVDECKFKSIAAIPCLHKFSVFRFAKENTANSTRDVTKVYFVPGSAPKIRKDSSFILEIIGIEDSCKKIRNQHDVRGRRRGRRRREATSGIFETVRISSR